MAFTAYSGSFTFSSTAHVKGAYTEIVASTPYASSRLYLILGSASSQGRKMLVDLATGTAGAETVVVANVAATIDVGFLTGTWTLMTLDLPAGTRLAIRGQQDSSTPGVTESFAVYLEDRALGSLATPVTYGANTAATAGTQVDPGTTVSTKGSYVQVTASTTARMDVLTVCVTLTQAGSTFVTAFTEWLIDIATGGAGSETVIVPDLRVMATTAVDCAVPRILQLAVVIPAGTRLAVRCQCNRNTALERLLAVTLIGMQEPASGGGGAAGAVAYVG